MPQSIESIIKAAATRNGWATSADMHRALKAAGIDVPYQTARNWWTGATKPAAAYAGPLADLCGVARVVVYEATAEVKP
ncbi:MAG TPA: hypothetical protein VI911_04115 [Patescibacteria group bacterium]|nr:hypothetical protein [Patescibacteria group bacterium]